MKCRLFASVASWSVQSRRNQLELMMRVNVSSALQFAAERISSASRVRTRVAVEDLCAGGLVEIDVPYDCRLLNYSKD